MVDPELSSGGTNGRRSHDGVALGYCKLGDAMKYG